MSAIFGFSHLDAAPAERDDLEAMAEHLKRRGPDRSGFWLGDSTALGHCLLATTPEALTELLPLVHPETGCVITADVRLDNRPDLIAELGLTSPAADIGDGELILKAYLAWGPECAARLLGDFAYAIWDPRHQRLVCARDKVGMRQLIYYHAPGRFFAFATQPAALLTLQRTPNRWNEGRIADFLVGALEAIDLNSTFFEDIYRLPPAHVLVVDRDAIKTSRYWRLEIGPELDLPSDEAYAEAFLEVFEEAVRARLRSPGPVGSMLSGGMDSSSIVAIASRLLARTGQGPLRTFSAAGPDPATCVETRTIYAALTTAGLQPTVIDHTQLGDLLPDLAAALRSVDEPFDYEMNLIRAVYLSGRRAGVKVMLDGAAGDLVLSHADAIVRFVRSGQWRRALTEAVGEEQFWGSGFPAWKTLLSGAFAAYAPDGLYEKVKAARRARAMTSTIDAAPIDPGFARRVNLPERVATDQSGATSRWESLAARKRASFEDPALVVGRERYDRVAGALAIEPRDPFLDIRVMELGLRLPHDQLVRNGWPKYILRQVTQGLLPDAVRWRRGKEHLGPAFTSAVIAGTANNGSDAVPDFAARFLKKYRYINGMKDEMSALVRDERRAQMSAFAGWLTSHPERR